ncbi:hypothetical protein [Gordonia sp. AC31]|uniref:hypothetical protein n=1 Tax=Gordonia sp. AC31 TaxID=2962571 RepID=UPI0028820FBF|nr:hypothetical protein [Gordonia sp. AC31]MDT0223363.1 hypothetical protein [Gordonia sp. AC31]
MDSKNAERDAARAVPDGTHFQRTVPRLGVYFVFAVDLTLLASERIPWENLARLRTDQEADPTKHDDVSRLGGTEKFARRVRAWMEQATAKRGKAVWNETFLASDSPFVLDHAPHEYNGRKAADSRTTLDDDPGSNLSLCKFMSSEFHLYRELVVTYTVEYEIDSRTSANWPSGLDVDRVIDILDNLGKLAWDNCKIQVARWTAERKDELTAIFGVPVSEDCAVLSTSDDFQRTARTHMLLVLGDLMQESATLSAAQVLDTPEVAGMLNTADWYRLYRPEYLSSLRAKNIGYRSDEVFLTDRKASLIANEKFWDQSNSLNEYRRDILFSIEYYLSRLAQSTSLLRYLQDDETIRGVANVDPNDALQGIISARRHVALLTESIDPARLVDHGFTRLFMQGLRSELGIDRLLKYAADRIDDATTSVTLRSAITAESNTASRALGVAEESRGLARSSLRVARASMWITIAVLVLTCIGIGVTVWLAYNA